MMWSLEDAGTCWVTDESTLVLIAVEYMDSSKFSMELTCIHMLHGVLGFLLVCWLHLIQYVCRDMGSPRQANVVETT